MVSRLFSRQSLMTKIVLGTLVTFLAGTWSISFFAVGMLRDDLQRALGAQQFSTVTLLAATINDEMEGRIKALEAAAVYFSPLLSGDPSILQSHLNGYPAVQQLFNGTVLVTRIDGTAIADVPHVPGRVGTSYMDRDVIVAALKEGKTTIGRPVIGKVLRAPLLTIGTPVRDRNGRVIGALLGAIDLAKPNFMDRISENRYGETGNFYIVDRRFRLIVTSSDKSRIMETQPPPGVNSTVDRAIQGDVSSAVYVNPRGVEVLGSAKGIPVADWYVGLIVPTKEAFATVRSMQERLLLGTLVFSLAACALVWWLTWRVLNRHFSPMIEATRALDSLSGTGEPPRPLPVANDDEIGELIGSFNHLLESVRHREDGLRNSEKRFQDIARASADWIWEVDADGQFLYASETVENVLGYKAAEIVGKTPFDFMPDSEAERLRALFTTIARNRESFRDLDNINVHKNGNLRYIQTTGVPVLDASGRLVGFRGLDRDITERKLAENKIRDSELRYRRLADKSPLAIQQFSTDGSTLRVNAAWERLWQTPFSALHGYNVLKDRQLEGLGVLTLLRRAFEGETVEFPEHLYDKAETPEVTGAAGQLWIRAFAYAVKDDGGQVLEVVLVQQDITERKRNEADLQLQSEITRMAAHGINIVRAADGAILYANPVFERMSGYVAGELIGKPVAVLNAGDESSAASVAESIMTSVQSKGEWHGELLNKRKDDSTFWTEAHVTRFEHPSLGVLMITHQMDITERKLAEDALRQSEGRFRSYFNLPLIGIAITSLSKGWVEVNERMCQIVGYSRAELDRLTWAEITHPDDLANDVTQFQRVLSGEINGYSLDKRFVRKDGAIVFTALSVQCVRKDDGQPDYFVALVQDITERKQLEDALNESRAELRSLNQSIETMREEDRRKIARELHDDLGHRLTTLRIDLDRLEAKMPVQDATVLARLTSIGGEVEGVVDAVRRISEDLRPGMLDALGLVAALESHAATFSERTGIQCEFTTSHETAKVSDQIAIGIFRVVQEALNNALKYAAATRILVSLRYSEDEIALVVQDNGKGLPKPAQGGRQGFGLIGMRERVTNLNGRLTISSEPGRGVRIEAVIPT